LGALSKGVASAFKEALKEFPGVMSDEEMEMFAKYNETMVM